MNVVEKCIREKGVNFDYCFVFPNSISQNICFNKALKITGISTLPSKLYISWHNFIKEYFVKDKQKELDEINDGARLLYAMHITERNAKLAQKGEPLFKSIIPPESAKNSSIFANWISSILNELHHFLYKKVECEDAELDDFYFLANDYNNFLKTNNLFEPKWEKSKFINTTQKFIIIYPELIDDFFEYKDVLQENKNIEYLHVKNIEKEETLREFENTRLEIKHVVSEIEALLLSKNENGESLVYSDEIALSVADINSLKAYIAAEFEMRGIPVNFYVRSTLTENSFCSVFMAIKEVVETRYSFDSIKKLFLNHSAFWKIQDFIENLIDFGISHNCAYSWQEGNIWHNIWDETFKTTSILPDSEHHLREAFRTFKKSLELVYNARTFKEMEENIRFFFNEYIDTNRSSKFDEKTVAVYKRIIKELKQLEVKLNGYFDELSINRYSFFISILEKKEVNLTPNSNGLAVFPYGAASAVPFKYHFVINMNQKNGSVIKRKLIFLRDDKRSVMNVKDVDLSEYFISSYKGMDKVFFSYSKKTYTSYEIAHSAFTNKKKIEERHPEDSFYNEECYFVENLKLKRIYKKQQIAIVLAEHFDHAPSFSVIKEPYYDKLPALHDLIKTRQYIDGEFAVSATNLNDYFVDCPVKFLFSRMFGIEKSNFNALMVDSKSIGNIYHSVLEKIYKQIMHTDGKFDKKHLLKDERSLQSDEIPLYRALAQKAFKDTLDMNARMNGPLLKLFIEVMDNQIMDAVSFVFNFDSTYLDKYVQYIIEGKYKDTIEGKALLTFKEDGILYNGKMDRVVKDSTGLVILDYKTSASKITGSIYNEVAEKMKDFQMPFYVFLLEGIEKEKTGKETKAEPLKVKGAYFLKLLPKEFVCSIKSDDMPPQDEKNKKTREAFEDAVNKTKKWAQEFKTKVQEGNFAPDDIIWKKCNECQFKYICRTTFVVCRRSCAVKGQQK